MSPFSIVLASLLLIPIDSPTSTDDVVEPTDQPAAADGSGPPSEAVEAFRTGRTLYARAEYEDALAAFRRADSLHPAADLQYNIALCHMRLHNWAEAIAGFEIYLRTKEDPPDRADVEARIAEARRNLARTSEEVVVTSPPVAMPTEPVATSADEPSPRERPWAGLVASGSLFLGLGAAGAIGGAAGFGVALEGKNDEIEEIVDAGNPRGVSYAESLRLQAQAEDYRTGLWVSVGLGSAVAVTGVALLAAGLHRRRDAKAIAVSPLVLPATGGVTLGGSF